MGDALEKILTSETFQQEIESNQGTMKQVFKFFKLVFPLYLKGIPVIIYSSLTLQELLSELQPL